MSLPVAKWDSGVFSDVMGPDCIPLGVQTFCPTHMTNMTFSSKSSLVLLSGNSGDYLTNMSYLICFIIIIIIIVII